MPGRRDVLIHGTLLGHVPPPVCAWPGSSVSPDCLPQDRVVQRKIRHQLLQPGIFSLQFLQPPRLIGADPAVLFPSAIIGMFSDVEGPAHVPHRLSLAEKNLGFSKLADDLFDCVAFSWHFDLSPSLNPNMDVGSAFGGQVRRMGTSWGPRAGLSYGPRLRRRSNACECRDR